MSRASSILSFCKNGNLPRVKHLTNSTSDYDWYYGPPHLERGAGSLSKNSPKINLYETCRGGGRCAAGRLFLIFSSFPHLEDAQHTWMHLEDAVNAENPQNRSFEGIITSQSNRPTQIFWPWILPASPCIFLLIQNFLRPFLSVRVYSFQSRPSLIQMKWL